VVQGGYLKNVMRYRYWGGIGASIILGLIFLVAGVGKLFDQTGLVTVLEETSILSRELVDLMAQWLPWIELVLGLCLVMGIAAKFMASASGLLVLGFIFHNTWIIEHGVVLDDCGCLGILEKMQKQMQMQVQIVLSSEMARYIDIGMLVLLLIVLFCYPGKFFTLRPWFLRQRKTNSGLGNSEGS
jgi:uncharacterized membrane protein YphA (DoxX/SURF4 family)